METKKEDISMNDIKEFVEKIMEEYNSGNMSQEKVAVLLKGAETIRTSFKTERQYNSALEKLNAQHKGK
jgi:hypothetical protein